MCCPFDAVRGSGDVLLKPSLYSCYSRPRSGFRQRERSRGFEPMFEFFGHFGREPGAARSNLKLNRRFFAEAVKVQFFVKQPALKRNLELLDLQHL